MTVARPAWATIAILFVLAPAARAAAPGEPAPDTPGASAPTPAAVVPAPAAAVPAPAEPLRAAVMAGRYGSAVVLCEEARRSAGDAELPGDTRALCGRAYVGLGDKLYAIGSLDGARQRWQEAAAIDPRLLDDPAFTTRLQSGGGDRALPDPGAEPAPPGPPNTPPAPAPAPAPAPEPGPVRPADAGPRYDRDFGAGLSVGFDGAAAVMISWMSAGTIAVDFSVGVVFPVFDIRVRWFGLRDALTPVLGLGMTTPFSDLNRFGGGLGSFHSLYELGETIHLDLGLSWAPTAHLDLFAGVAFVTPVDQQNPDTVLFFPQIAGQVAWYF